MAEEISTIIETNPIKSLTLTDMEMNTKCLIIVSKGIALNGFVESINI